MYPSLIGAGVSQLYGLLKSQTQSSSSPFGVSDPSTTSSGATATTGSATSSFSTDLNQLFVDLQGSSSSSATPNSTANASTSTDPTTSVANDLQNVFSDLKKAGAGHGHHHHHADANSKAGSTQATSASPATASNPFQGLASSLLAYANTQGLTSTQTTSTSLTA